MVSGTRDEKRRECQAVVRSYIDEFGYKPARFNGGESRFVNAEGDILTVAAIESTTRYRGFFEAFKGLDKSMPEDEDYMEGFMRGRKRVSTRVE